MRYPPDYGRRCRTSSSRKYQPIIKRKRGNQYSVCSGPLTKRVSGRLAEVCSSWNRIHALHMDEYIGLQADAPQRFGNYLKEHIFAALPFKSIHYLYIEGASPENICAHYEEVLQKHPIDIVFMGIGENGHIAFNDPHVALFDDPQQVKVVLLDEVCRTQQVHDGCFSSLEKVPQQAVTITIPVMMKATRIFCIVPGKPKANAVKETLYGPVSTTCPASILRTHPHATLYCDRDSASLLSI